MPKPDKPGKSVKPPKPRALPSHTLADLPLAAGKADELIVLKDDSGALVSLAISDGVTWLSVPVAGVLPPKPEDTL